jgi:hypothetical protein
MDLFYDIAIEIFRRGIASPKTSRGIEFQYREFCNKNTALHPFTRVPSIKWPAMFRNPCAGGDKMTRNKRISLRPGRRVLLYRQLH